MDTKYLSPKFRKIIITLLALSVLPKKIQSAVLISCRKCVLSYINDTLMVNHLSFKLDNWNVQVALNDQGVEFGSYKKSLHK